MVNATHGPTKMFSKDTNEQQILWPCPDAANGLCLVRAHDICPTISHLFADHSTYLDHDIISIFRSKLRYFLENQNKFCHYVNQYLCYVNSNNMGFC